MAKSSHPKHSDPQPPIQNFQLLTHQSACKELNYSLPCDCLYISLCLRGRKHPSEKHVMCGSSGVVNRTSNPVLNVVDFFADQSGFSIKLTEWEVPITYVCFQKRNMKFISGEEKRVFRTRVNITRLHDSSDLAQILK